MSSVGRNHPEWQVQISCSYCKKEQIAFRRDLFLFTPRSQTPDLLPTPTSVLSPNPENSIVGYVCSNCGKIIVIDSDADGWANLPEYQTPLISNDPRWYW